METAVIALDQERAKELYEEYRAHRHYATAIDREIQRAYRLIAQGKTVIRALASIPAAGLGEDKLPKLAIARATQTRVMLNTWEDGRARMAAPNYRVAHTRSYFDFPAGSFPGVKAGEFRRSFESIVPLVPVKYRPRQALDEYHILFEAEWRQAVPADPMLLRRIGNADLWLVVAAWDLTEVELAALSARVRP